MRVVLPLCCALLLAMTLGGVMDAHASEADDCRIGSYRSKDGSLVDIAPASSDALRWRRFDGSTGALRSAANGEWRSSYGWTDRPDGKRISFPDCRAGEIDFDGVRGERIAFEVRDTSFRSHDTALAGRLVMPKGEGKLPLVILLLTRHVGASTVPGGGRSGGHGGSGCKAGVRGHGEGLLDRSFDSYWRSKSISRSLVGKRKRINAAPSRIAMIPAR